MANKRFLESARKFQCLFDKMPPLKSDAPKYLEGNWWRRDRDEVTKAVCNLGYRLELIQGGIELARTAGDLGAVRGGTVKALMEIQEHLLPILGADRLWSIGEAMDALEHAAVGKRHWLTRLDSDEVHIRRDAPNRVICQTLVAAALDFFDGKLNPRTQGEIATELAEAMGRGGFYVAQDKRRVPPSGRTVQDWRAKFMPGTRLNRQPPPQKLREMFGDLQTIFQQNQGDDLTVFFKKVLVDVEVHCRDRSELLAQVTRAKFGG